MVLFHFTYNLLDFPHCVCGLAVDADHYDFACSLSKEFHLKKPADAHKTARFRSLINNKSDTKKIMEAFVVCNATFRRTEDES